MNKKIIVSDCDGILTSANLTYDVDGKCQKHFSVNDSLDLKLLREVYGDLVGGVVVLTGDKEPGISITKTRLDEIGLLMLPCKNVDKYSYIRDRWGLENVVYFGDDIFDLPTLMECAWSGTVADAPLVVQRAAKYTSTYVGGANGFTDLVMRALENYFEVDPITDIVNFVKGQKA